ncbi:MAG: peptidylprolyl isomerase [Planctomycetota bacterium]|jgi:peptidyl-prolyl cis-trans isomerase C
MKLYASKLALFFLGLLIAFCLCCAEKDQEADKSTAVETKQVETDPNAVAKISNYTIKKEELEKRLMMELRPNPYEPRSETETPNAKAVLMKMIAEKAMVIEARKQKLHEDETIQAVTKRFMEKNLVNSLLKTHLQGKITITDLEIDKMIKSDPKLDRARAKAMLTRAKSGQLLGQYYNELYKKFHVQKLSENFFKAAQIHQRLLFQPKEPRKVGFIRIRQIKNELTPEEKNIVLATYDNGKITLKDWLDTLCEMSPPSRPKDLNTTKGVEQLLERALKMPIFISEAKLLGLDKDENLLKQVKEYEDGILLNKARNEKIKDIKGPIPDEQIVDYFNNNKEVFGTQNTLKIDQIWCQDLKTAQKAKAELDNGKDFESVRKTYSLQEKSSPFDTYSDNEGLFFKDLWNSDPNKVVGPVKGFYRDGFKWRIVKILEKKPGTVTEYSVEMKQNIEMKMLDEQRNTILEEYRKELLKKYSYEIYDERIRDIDPLDIP